VLKVLGSWSLLDVVSWWRLEHGCVLVWTLRSWRRLLLWWLLWGLWNLWRWLWRIGILPLQATMNTRRPLLALAHPHNPSNKKDYSSNGYNHEQRNGQE
jgi:hypothetical protein